MKHGGILETEPREMAQSALRVIVPASGLCENECRCGVWSRNFQGKLQTSVSEESLFLFYHFFVRRIILSGTITREYGWDLILETRLLRHDYKLHLSFYPIFFFFFYF